MAGTESDGGGKGTTAYLPAFEKRIHLLSRSITKADNPKKLPAFVLPYRLAVVFFQQPFDVVLFIEDFATEYNERQQSCIAVFLQCPAAYFQPFSHLLVRQVAFPVQWRTVFGGQPDYFAGQIAQIVQAGASIVGGCCGTTPEHIAQTAQALKEPLPKCTVSAPKKLLKPAANASNSLWEKLEAGKRVIAVELDPPVDDDSAGFWEGVQALRGSGADAVTIADCPIGRPRADSSLLACKIKRDIGIEPLPHMTCRDRNLNATKALLLGLSMEGVHNVLVVTGDPIPTEDRNEVKSVFNFNSRKLARFVHMLNENTLRTPFRIYGALNLNARNFDVELRRAQEKEACGVSGFLTQPVLSAEALDNLKLAHKTLRGKILGGIFPVVSHRNACFLNNEISGMRVCDEIIHLYEGKDRDAAEALAVTVSTAIAKEIFPYTDGYYLMTPFRRVALMEHIIQNIQQSHIS